MVQDAGRIGPAEARGASAEIRRVPATTGPWKQAGGPPKAAPQGWDERQPANQRQAIYNRCHTCDIYCWVVWLIF